MKRSRTEPFGQFSEPGSHEAQILSIIEDGSCIYDDPERSRSCLRGLESLLRDRVLCDVTIAVDNKEFLCHRLILAASSPYFRAMFQHEFVEQSSRKITLNQVGADSFDAILHYLYNGRVKLNAANVQGVFLAAHMFQIPSLECICASYMEVKITPQNCIEVYFFAFLYEQEKLLLAARNVIGENFLQIVRSEEFLNLPAGQASEILSLTIARAKEEEVYSAAVAWIKQGKKKQADIYTVMKSVRFALLDERVFRQRVKNNLLFKDCPQLQGIFEQMLYFLNHPNRWHEVDLPLEPRVGCSTTDRNIRSITYSSHQYLNHYLPEPEVAHALNQDRFKILPNDVAEQPALSSKGLHDLYVVGGSNINRMKVSKKAYEYTLTCFIEPFGKLSSMSSGRTHWKCNSQNVQVTMAGVDLRQLLAVLVVMVMSGIFVSFPLMAKLDHGSTYARIIQSSLVFVGIIVMVISYSCGRYGRRPHRQGVPRRNVVPDYGDEITAFLDKFKHVIAIYLFGSSALIFRLYYVLASAACIKKFFKDVPDRDPSDSHSMWWYKLDEVSHLTLVSLHLVYISCKIPFLVRLNNYKCVRTKRTAFVHQALLVMIGVDFADWVFSFLRENGTIKVYDAPPFIMHSSSYNFSATEVTHANSSHNHELAIACMGHTTAMYAYENDTVRHIFFPMSLEFMLTSVEVILHVLMLQHEPEDHPQDIEVGGVNALHYQHPNYDNNHHFDNDIPGPLFQAYVKKWYHKLWKFLISRFTTLAALLVGMVDAVLTNYYLVNDPEGDRIEYAYYYHEKHLKNFVQTPVIIGRVIFVYIPATVVTLHCCCILKTFKKVRRNVPAVQSGDVVLILAALGHIVLRFYQLIVCILAIIDASISGHSIDVRLSSFCALEALLSLLQNILSVLVIYYGERREATFQDTLHPFFSTLQGSLSFLTLFSLLRWVIDSFYEMEFLLHKNSLLIEHGGMWKIVVIVCLPFVIYFRFICVERFLRIRRLLRETEAD